MNEIQLKEQSKNIIEQATDLVVFSSEDNLQANQILARIMKAKKEVTNYWKEPIEKAFATHKSLTTKKAEMLKVVKKAEDIVKTKICAYVGEQRRLEYEAKEKARKEEEARLAEIRKREEELEEAKGHLTPEQILSEKNRIEAEKTMAPLPEIKEVEEIPEGQVVKTLYYAEVKDFSALPDKYKLPNMQMLNAIARAEKDRLSIPGVVVLKKINVSTRTY